MRRLLAASSTLAVLLVPAAPLSSARPDAQRPVCPRRFTVRMTERAADAVTRGTRVPTRRNLRLLGHLERCQRNPAARPFVRGYDHRALRANASRRRAADPRYWPTAVASWFTDYSEGTACGFHAAYGVAHRTLPCGTRVEFAYRGREVEAVVEDRGPYVGGRTWDLGASTASALGFSGVDDVSYRIR